MGDASLHREIRLAVGKADVASDPKQNALMDRTDLQRVIAQLRTTLKKVECAYDQLERDRSELSERLTRNHVEPDWTSGAYPQAQ